MAKFLESRGMPEQALEVATDADYRFELAVQVRTDCSIALLSQKHRTSSLGSICLTQLAEDVTGTPTYWCEWRVLAANRDRRTKELTLRRTTC